MHKAAETTCHSDSTNPSTACTADSPSDCTPHPSATPATDPTTDSTTDNLSAAPPIIPSAKLNTTTAKAVDPIDPPNPLPRAEPPNQPPNAPSQGPGCTRSAPPAPGPNLGPAPNPRPDPASGPPPTFAPAMPARSTSVAHAPPAKTHSRHPSTNAPGLDGYGQSSHRERPQDRRPGGGMGDPRPARPPQSSRPVSPPGTPPAGSRKAKWPSHPLVTPATGAAIALYSGPHHLVSRLKGTLQGQDCEGTDGRRKGKEVVGDPVRASQELKGLKGRQESLTGGSYFGGDEGPSGMWLWL